MMLMKGWLKGLFAQTGLNETYLNTLETEGKITKLFNDAYSKLSPETRADIAHSAKGELNQNIIVMKYNAI